MNRVYAAVAMGLAVGIGGAAADPIADPIADPLAVHRWRSRVLVISAADAGDRHLADQRAALAAARDGVGERDLVTVEAIGAAAAARAVRDRLGLPGDAFRTVLVGKDGAAKIVSASPIPVRRLFATIDAMPMRRGEVGRR